jgi:hypothetical protein
MSTITGNRTYNVRDLMLARAGTKASDSLSKTPPKTSPKTSEDPVFNEIWRGYEQHTRDILTYSGSQRDQSSSSQEVVASPGLGRPGSRQDGKGEVYRTRNLLRQGHVTCLQVMNPMTTTVAYYYHLGLGPSVGSRLLEVKVAPVASLETFIHDPVRGTLTYECLDASINANGSLDLRGSTEVKRSYVLDLNTGTVHEDAKRVNQTLSQGSHRERVEMPLDVNGLGDAFDPQWSAQNFDPLLKKDSGWVIGDSTPPRCRDGVGAGYRDGVGVGYRDGTGVSPADWRQYRPG